MDRAGLVELITKHAMDEHRDFIVGIARPSVNIFVGGSEPSAGSSKFGGNPDLPPDFPWPTHAAGLYKFVAQFALSDPAFSGLGLPADGLLSFFCSAGPDGYEDYYEGADFIRAFHFRAAAGLRPHAPPAPVDRGPCRAVDLKPGLSLPNREWYTRNSVPWPFVTEEHDSEYWELQLDTIPGYSYLFGYPFNNTLGYDPTPGPDWHSLLTLASHDEMEWSWHDGSWLVTFIQEQQLRLGDFSAIKSDAG